MKPLLAIPIAFAVTLAVSGHSCGESIRIDVVNNQLVVSQGTLTSDGYVDRIFADATAVGSAGTLTGFGAAQIWGVPTFNINGMAENSGLYIDVIARPVSNSSPPKDRVLWYWNATTGSVEDAPVDNHFTIYRTSSLQRILAGTDSTEPSRLKFASPFTSDVGFDNQLLRYGIHRQVPPPAGLYGFFARLSSDVYGPSDPFLILVNNGVLGTTQVMAGANAINAAADDASLPGDFNGNGTVDAADYTVWRDGLGSIYTQAHYTEWKNHFGQSAGSAASAAATTVPEPAGFALAIGGMLALLTRRSLLRSRHSVVN